MTMRIGEVLTMDEYIRREDVIAWFMPYAHVGESIDADVVISDIKGMKAADVAPVVHGSWGTHSDRPDSLICSVCKCGFDMWKHDPHNYCPNCGAKMDGGDSDEVD